MAKASIRFFTEEIKFELKSKRVLKDWITNTILQEKKRPGAINYIFCNDPYLHSINLRYLNHDFYTDIITFDNSEKSDTISGDIFISIERVKDNAEKFQISLNQELSRVLIHGILHLIGYDDSTTPAAKLMRKKEDYYLSLLPDISR